MFSLEKFEIIYYQIYGNIHTHHGVRHGGGGQGGHGPPKERIGGASNAFGPPPPIFWENSVMKHN